MITPRSGANREDGGSGGLLHLRFFGGFEACHGQTPLPRTRTRKEVWLLALLTLRHGQAVDRSWLAGTLWPDSREAQALAYLRGSLSDLRGVLGPADARRLCAPSSRTVSLDLSGAFCDVLAFDAAIARGDPALLEEAVRLYRGPLLEACQEGWLLPEQEARAQEYLGALESLAARAMAAHNPPEAVRLLQRVIAADPLREPAQRFLMEALAAAGDMAGATLVYRQFRLRLSDELRSEPSAETSALYQRLRTEARSRRASSPGAAVFSPPHRHLPRSVSALVGRADEIRGIRERLGVTRLVTLTGTGGVGKTRLAVAVAEAALADDGCRDGVCFVDFAPLTDAAFLPAAVAAALGVREEAAGRPLVETLAEFLAPKHLLLILDNCEHLIEACARLAAGLLRTCHDVRILATSRRSLGLPGEAAYRVPSLETPPSHSAAARGGESTTEAFPAAAGALHAFFAFDAVRLFVERAMDASTDFALTERNAGPVAQICHRLDGIPLALELAAARVKVLSPEQIAARIDDRFRLLTGGSRAALPRQQTLRALVDWSYDLLEEPEKRLLRRLSVFAGGWTLEAAEAVCAGDGIEDREVLDLLAGLVDKSLVTFDEAEGGEGRYRLLETLRQYGRERLAQTEAAAAVAALHARHRACFLALAEEARPQLVGPEQARWLRRLEAEHDNLRAALAACAADLHGGEVGLRLAGALTRFWDVRGHPGEGRRFLAEALARNGAQAPTTTRLDALNGAAALAYHQGDLAAVEALQTESLALSREMGDRQSLLYTLNNLGIVTQERGDYPAARALYEESLALSREMGDSRGLFSALNNLASISHDQGDNAAARRLFEETLALKRASGDGAAIASALCNVAAIAQEQGDYAAARTLLEESLALSRELKDPRITASALHNLGVTAFNEGDGVAARSLLLESLAIQQEQGNRLGSVECLECLAKVMAEQKHPARAVRLWGATGALREALGVPLPPAPHSERDCGMSEARAALGEGTFAAAWDRGRAMTLEQTASYALSGKEED